MQGFERHFAEFVRARGLTHPQFDIIATLGNTPGMSYKELGEKTLITKGTLTGVIERLEMKGLVKRERCDIDKRSFYVRLTPCGEAMFAEVFPQVLAQGRLFFAGLTPADFDTLDASLHKLKAVIAANATPSPVNEKETY